MVIVDEVIHDVSFTARAGQKLLWLVNPVLEKHVGEAADPLLRPATGKYLYRWAENNGNELRGIE